MQNITGTEIGYQKIQFIPPTKLMGKNCGFLFYQRPTFKTTIFFVIVSTSDEFNTNKNGSEIFNLYFASNYIKIDLHTLIQKWI